MADALTESKAAGSGEPSTPETAPSPTPPPLASKARDLEAIRAAVVDAAGVSAGFWLSYLLVLFYLLIAAGGVTHRDLFFESPVKLPFLNVDLPVKGFFWLSPVLFLIVHVYVLLHFVMLGGKVRVFDIELRAQIEDPEVRKRLRRQLPSNIFVQFLGGPGKIRDGIVGLLLWLIALISLVIAPVALLVFFQLQFLPYHDPWITWWQRIAVLLDLILLWWLWPPISRGQNRPLDWTDHRNVRGAVWLLASLLPLLLVFTIATFPGEWLEENLPPVRLIPTTLAAWTLPSVEAIQTAGSGWATLHELLIAGEVDFAARKPKSLWSNRLVLPGFDAIDHTKLDTEAKIAAATETVSLRSRHLEGTVLIGAVLRKVDFAGAYLQGADLTTADLRNANFACAGLANSPSGLSVRVGDNVCTQLQGAKLKGAQLQGAALRVAQLQGADLLGAQLQGADLSSAQLQGAKLLVAQLQGADLLGAQLQGADLTGAVLDGATLPIAELQGTNLSASLKGANLGGAQLQGADLAGAVLDGASLRNVFVWRADARFAKAKGAWIDMVVSGPKQWCGNRNGPAGCDWSDVWWSDFKKGIEHEVLEGETRANVLKRIDPKLDPAKPLKDESEMAQRWAELQSSSLTLNAYEDELFNQWQRIGCAADGAPYVLTAQTRMLQHWRSPFRVDSVQPARLAAEFLKDDCAGARGLSEDTREILKALSLRVPIRN